MVHCTMPSPELLHCTKAMAVGLRLGRHNSRIEFLDSDAVMRDGGRDAGSPSRSNSCGSVTCRKFRRLGGVFETPGEGRRCACIGAGNCSEMKNSDSCASGPECDKSELGAIICSCKAARTSRTGL